MFELTNVDRTDIISVIQAKIGLLIMRQLSSYTDKKLNVPIAQIKLSLLHKWQTQPQLCFSNAITLDYLIRNYHPFTKIGFFYWVQRALCFTSQGPLCLRFEWLRYWLLSIQVAKEFVINESDMLTISFSCLEGVWNHQCWQLWLHAMNDRRPRFELAES